MMPDQGAIEVVSGIDVHTTPLGAVDTTRRREVWTRAEKRILDRAARAVSVDHGDKLALTCGRATCPDRQITFHADRTSPGGAVLRCGCTDRVFNGV